MRIHLSTFSILTCLVFSSVTHAANEPLGQWPAKPVEVKPKQFKTIFGNTGPVANSNNSPAMVKARQEKERKSVLPQNESKIPQFGWRMAPELLGPDDLKKLKLSPNDTNAINTRVTNATQTLQQALIPALKGKRYLVNEIDHLDARFQLAELARRMNKEMLLARQKTWTIAQADTLYSALSGSLERKQIPNKHPIITNLICSQLLTDMVTYIYKPTELRFEQYVSLMNQRRFCGKFPSSKMEGSLKLAYGDENLRQLLEAVKHPQTQIFIFASQKVIADITGFTPQQALQAKKQQASQIKQQASTPSLRNTDNTTNIKEKGLKGELPKPPFRYSFDELDQVGYYLESIVGTGEGKNLRFTVPADSVCSILHPEIRANRTTAKAIQGLKERGVKSMMQHLHVCTLILGSGNPQGAKKLRLFYDQYSAGIQ